MKSFKQFLLEKDVSDVKESTLYIACPLPKDHWEVRADQVEGLESAVEVEDNPYCTFLWCNLTEDYDTDKLYGIVNPILKGVTFKLNDKGFETFKGVEQGKQDCVVVRLEPPADVVELQQKVKDALESNGIKFTQTYPEWKPHMTIAYFKAGFNLKEKHTIEGNMKPLQVDRLFMKHNNGNERDFK
jgi:2'-5' RNA ligase